MEAESWLRSLSLSPAPDAIVAVARAGLPFGVGLSYLNPDAEFLVMTRAGREEQKAWSYKPQIDRDARKAMLLDQFQMTDATKPLTSALIIDDVATSGDTLRACTEILRNQHSGCDVNYAAFAADVERLEHLNPEILKRMSYCRAIDNSKVWVTFPWNLKPLVTTSA